MDILQLLQNHNIPYNKKNIKENVIIIPGGIIKVKNFQTIKNNYDIEAFIKIVNNLITTYNQIIYIYMENINENYYMFLQYVYTKIDINKVIITDSINNINVGVFYYIIKSTGALWTFFTNYNYFYPIFQNFKIICPIDTYNRAIVIMNEDELLLLHSYKLELVDNNFYYDDNKLCVITQNTFQERCVFTYVIKYVPLNGGNRSPCRVVDGITCICPICNNITYITDGVIRKHHPCNNIMS